MGLRVFEHHPPRPLPELGERRLTLLMVASSQAIEPPESRAGVVRRSHQGYRLAGRTPAQALQEALGITELPPVVAAAEGEEEPSAA